MTTRALASAPAATATAPAPTRASFIAAGDATCAAVNARLASLQRTAKRIADDVNGGRKELSDLAPSYDRVYDLERAGTRRLEAADRPSGDDAPPQALFEAYEQQTALVAREADAARRDDQQDFIEIGREIERVTSRAHALAQGYGFKRCGADD